MFTDLYNAIPDTFFAMIACQFLLFIILAFINKCSVRKKLRILKQGLLLGVPLGLFFDSMAGFYGGVFDYGEGYWNVLFLLLNGLLSYGIAIATILIFNISSPKINAHKNKFLNTFLFFMALAGILVFIFVNEFVLGRMIGIGLSIVFLGEFLLLNYAQKYGPISSLFKRNAKPFLQLFSIGVLMGFVYEIFNWYSPLWYWTQSQFLTKFQLEIAVVLLGYFVLVHLFRTTSELYKSIGKTSHVK
ncbi:hypothetical protein ACFLY0_00545 [Patescibacteria group bacterium]